MIAPGKVKQTLLPWLGSRFLDAQEPLCGQVAMILFSFRKDRDHLIQLAQRIDNLLFMAVRETTNARMALLMDNGDLIRLKIDDFRLMADETLYLLFESMEKTPDNQAFIREFALRSGSLSALRALYLMYFHLHSPEETKTIRRIITTCHEPFRYRQWIRRPDEEQDPWEK